CAREGDYFDWFAYW
nr:immunoglobulin heavy chain junction region [Mus musculus]